MTTVKYRNVSLRDRAYNTFNYFALNYFANCFMGTERINAER